MNHVLCITSALVSCMVACASGPSSTDSSDGGAPGDSGHLATPDATGQDAAHGDAGAGGLDAHSAADAPAEASTDSGAQPEASSPEASTGLDAVAPPPTSLDLHDVTLFDNPANLADWPVTTTITDVEFQYQGADGVHVEFSKQSGAGAWPDVTPPGWTGPLQYTLGFAEYIGGQWYGSAAVQYWSGLPQMGGNVASDTKTLAQCTAFGLGSTCQVAANWYYDGRWGNLAGYQPATGEWIGVFVAAGNLRGVTDGSQSPVQERSNVVLVQMPTFAGAQYTF